MNVVLFQNINNYTLIKNINFAKDGPKFTTINKITTEGLAIAAAC